MIHIENLNMTINTATMTSGDIETGHDSDIRTDLVDTLRIISKDERLKHETLVIPEICEQYGFSEGNYRLPELLHFLADMLE
ncbi:MULTISPECIES: hypothetical protein [unclassified Psychrobacter]|uniref:hypothetical protein n=1 Tax=unclassified Psychrobacter TaxID=196806 RepID=UPI0018F5924C|nr:MULTISPECIES: hypothetical protein [unclassified Psychrobacter]